MSEKTWSRYNFSVICQILILKLKTFSKINSSYHGIQGDLKKKKKKRDVGYMHLIRNEWTSNLVRCVSSKKLAGFRIRCISYREVIFLSPRKECPVYNTQLHLIIRLQFGWVWCTPLLPLFSCSLRFKVVEPIGVPSRGLIDPFKNFISIGPCAKQKKLLRNNYTKIVIMNVQWTGFPNLLV